MMPLVIFAQENSLVQTEVLTIKEAVAIAMKENHDIKIARNNISIAENNAGIMNSGYMPTLGAKGAYNYKNEDVYQNFGSRGVAEQDGAQSLNYNYGVALNYRVFDGMSRFYNSKKFDSRLTVSELQARATIENVLMQLIVGYYQIANQVSRYENQKRTIDISKERLLKIKTQAEFGQATKLDVLKAEVDRNKDSINLFKIENSLQVLQRNFNVVLSRDVHTKFIVDTNVIISKQISETEMLTLAQSKNVEYLLAQQNVLIASFDTASKKSGYMPKIDINGGYNYVHQDNEVGFMLESESQGYNASAILSWNIFDGGRTHTQVQNAKILELNAEERVFNQENNLERMVSNAYVTYKNSKYILKAEETNMETNKLNYSYSKEKFSLGLITSIDYRNAQVNLQNSINQYNDAKFTAKIAELQLIKLAGLFMQEM